MAISLGILPNIFRHSLKGWRTLYWGGATDEHLSWDLADRKVKWRGRLLAGCKHYSYGHLSVITGYFYGIIHSINEVISTYNW